MNGLVRLQWKLTGLGSFFVTIVLLLTIILPAFDKRFVVIRPVEEKDFVLEPLGAGWYSPSWSYRKLITINESKISNTLVNFPVLIYRASDSDLASDSKCQNDGDDIIFVKYSDNTTKLNHEIESFNGATGNLVAWVNVTVSGSTDTKIWMYYGNSGCSSQQNMYGVWDSYFKAVYHQNYTASTTVLLDSSANKNNATKSGTISAYAGKLDGASDYSGGSGPYYTTPTLFASNPSAITQEVWFYPDTITSDDGVWSVYNTTQLPSFAIYNSKWWIGIRVGSTTYIQHETYPMLNTQWQQVVITYDDADDYIRYYHQGKEVTTNLTAGGVYRSKAFWIGRYAGTSNCLDGKMDETRFSSVARNLSWINASYINQNQPTTFHSVGTEESSGTVWHLKQTVSGSIQNNTYNPTTYRTQNPPAQTEWEGIYENYTLVSQEAEVHWNQASSDGTTQAQKLATKYKLKDKYHNTFYETASATNLTASPSIFWFEFPKAVNVSKMRFYFYDSDGMNYAPAIYDIYNGTTYINTYNTTAKVNGQWVRVNFSNPINKTTNISFRISSTRGSVDSPGNTKVVLNEIEFFENKIPTMHPQDSIPLFTGISKYWNGLSWAICVRVDDCNALSSVPSSARDVLPITAMLFDLSASSNTSLVGAKHMEVGSHGGPHSANYDKNYSWWYSTLTTAKNGIETWTTNTSIWSDKAISYAYPVSVMDPPGAKALFDAGFKFAGWLPVAVGYKMRWLGGQNISIYNVSEPKPEVPSDWLLGDGVGYAYNTDYQEANHWRENHSFAIYMMHNTDSLSAGFVSLIENDITGWHCTQGEIASYGWNKNRMNVTYNDSSDSYTKIFDVDVWENDTNIWEVPMTFTFDLNGYNWNGSIKVEWRNNNTLYTKTLQNISKFLTGSGQHKNQTMREGYRWDKANNTLYVSVKPGDYLKPKSIYLYSGLGTAWKTKQIISDSIQNLTKWRTKQIISGSIVNLTIWKNKQVISGSIVNSTIWKTKQTISGSIVNTSIWRIKQIITGSIQNNTWWKTKQLITGSLTNLTNWRTRQIISGSFKNDSINQWKTKQIVSSSLINNTIWRLKQTITGSITNSTKWKTKQLLTGSILDSTKWRTGQTIAGSITNLSKWTTKQIISGSLLNLTKWRSKQIVSGSIINISIWRTKQIVSGSIANITKWRSKQIVSGSIVNLSLWKTNQIISGLLSNTTKWWNKQTITGSVINSTIWRLKQTLSGSIVNTTIWKTKQIIASSFKNDSINLWKTKQTISGSIINNTLWRIKQTISGSIINTTIWRLRQTISGAITNTTEWKTTQTITGSIHNESLEIWRTKQIISGSLLNTTNWRTKQIITGTINGYLAWRNAQTIDGLLQNNTGWRTKQILSGSITNMTKWRTKQVIASSFHNDSTIGWTTTQIIGGTLKDSTIWKTRQIVSGSLRNISGFKTKQIISGTMKNNTPPDSGIVIVYATPNNTHVPANNIVLKVNLYNINGTPMNIEWYWNDGGTWTYLNKVTNVPNGTYSIYTTVFSILNHDYQWRVNTNSTGYPNVTRTLNFTTGSNIRFGGGGGYSISPIVAGFLGAIISIGFIFIMIALRFKKRRDE